MIIDVVLGFLGSGKTTFILNILKIISSQEKIAVIVNEFGDLGIDGAVLAQENTEVVELPSGCICCTLSRDLVGQVEMLAKNYAPQRLLIEPSGVATVNALLQTLGSLKLERYVDELRLICIIDAINFFTFYKQNRLYVESQMESAGLIVINKADLEDEKTVAEIASLVTAHNRKAKVVVTSFCEISLEDYRQAGQLSVELHDHAEAGHDHAIGIMSHEEYHHATENHAHGAMSHIPSIKDLESISLQYDDSFNAYEFNLFLQSLKRQEFGEVVRAKGIVHLDQRGWVLFNLASGYITVTPMEKVQAGGKMFIAGLQLHEDLIVSKLDSCKFRGN